MAFHDEHADILGGPLLKRPESGFFATSAQYRLVFKSFTLLGLGLLVWIACARGLEHLRRLRELRYKKAMRRQHGIPDSDCRPFAVAYAAAKRAHLEREAQNQKKTTNYMSDHNPPDVDQRTNTHKAVRSLRRRVPETTRVAVQPHDYQFPGKPASLYDNKRLEVHSLDFVDRYSPGPRHRVAVLESLPIEQPPIRRAGKKDLVINSGDREESRKRSFEDVNDGDHETLKKSRTDSDERTDGDDQADWYAQYSHMPPWEASKESLVRQPEDNYGHMSSQETSKHINDLRDEDHEPVDEAMGGIDEDEVTGRRTVARGRKRDRAEAGSTFGGDEEEDIQNGRALHYRKRRTVLRRTEIPLRGQKRDRGFESPGSEGEGDGSEPSRRSAQRTSKKKRGKKSASDEVSEMLEDDFRISKDPLCDGRRVGDEWEVDGAQYKVGDKGERLRLTLVKRAKNKYHMPQDSQHPDRSAALEIYVETWMTDEQYKKAEERQELTWQETPKELGGSKVFNVLDSSTKTGKNLLWDSVNSSPARRPFHQLMPVGASTRFNPFEQWQVQPTLGRRVASSSATVSPLHPGVADSPTRPGFRGFSKWEKQDREAEAMARIRAKIEEQKKVQAPLPKSAEIPTSVTAPELGTKSLPVPTITLTPVPSIAAEGKPDDSTLLSKSNISTFFVATSPNTSDPTKSTTAAASTTPGFSPPSASIPAVTVSTLSPSAQVAPATTSSTVPLSSFSFAKPPQLSSSIPTATSSTMSNLFGKGTGVGTPSMSNPLPPTLGPQSQPSSTENVFKPVLLSFAKPVASSSTLSPAVVTPPGAKSQVPIFGATSTSSPSPVASGCIPVAANAEVPVPPPVSTTTTASESSKPTTPLFSFSGVSSAPKFSFGQPSTTPTSAFGFNFAAGTTSQPKPTFKFTQTPPGAMDGASTSTVPVLDESKKSAVSVSVFGTATGPNEFAKPPTFGTASAFGNSSSSSAVSTNLFGKPVAMNDDVLPSTSSKPMSASASTPTFNNTHSSTPAAGAPAPGSTPTFSFSGTSSTSMSADGPRSASLFGGAIEGPKPVSMLGGSSTEGRPTFTFGASAEGSKPASTFGGNTESSKSLPVFGGSAETFKPSPVSGGPVEELKPMSRATEDKSTSDPATESSQPTTLFSTTSESMMPPNTTEVSKLTSTPGSTTWRPSPALTFTFGKDDVAPNVSTSTSMQTKPPAPFTFGALSGANGSVFDQPSTGTSAESSQSVFDKPANATPSAFGFVATGSSGSSSTFTFGKPAAQSQKQEQ